MSEQQGESQPKPQDDKRQNLNEDSLVSRRTWMELNTVQHQSLKPWARANTWSEKEHCATSGRSTGSLNKGQEGRYFSSVTPQDWQLSMVCWTSAVRFRGKLLLTGPAMVASARFCSLNPSNWSVIQLVANAASSCILRWQGPRSHWSTHVADTVALELGALLPWIFSLQELFGLAIPKKPLAHARLVLTQVDVRDCQNCEKCIWVSFHEGSSTGSGTFSGSVVPFSTTRSFLIVVLKKGNVMHQGFGASTTGVVSKSLFFASGSS